ncbi:MAG: hypothetical protein HY646_20865 [Acidobacteria bacterium]|nr:hypothetical protein [Acidobacteriota bacterium]
MRRWLTPFGAVVLLASLAGSTILSQVPQQKKEDIQFGRNVPQTEQDREWYSKVGPNWQDILRYVPAGAPTTDMYYFNVPLDERVPDIFITYPDVWARVKQKVVGYHLPPIPLEMRTAKKKMMAGESMEVVGWFEEPSEVDPFSMIWQGPNGRRIEVGANLRQVPNYDPYKDPDFPEFLKSQPPEYLAIVRKVSGRLSMPPWAEPGVYMTQSLTGVPNVLGQSKSYRPDFHPGLQRSLYFELLPNPKYQVDVTPPQMDDFSLGVPLGESAVGKKFNIRQPIPVYLKATDENSGVNSVLVTLASPTRKFVDLTLVRGLEKDVYVGNFNINRSYEGGEYTLARVNLTDKARNDRFYFPTTHPKLSAAKIMVEQDPANVDKKGPEMFTIALIPQGRPVARLDLKPEYQGEARDYLDSQLSWQGDEIKIVGIFTDDESGVGNIAVSVHEEDSISKFRVSLKPKALPPVLIKPGMDVTENVWEGSFRLAPFHQPGHWRIERVLVRDNANNYTDYRHMQVQNIAAQKVYIIPTNPNVVKGRQTTRFEEAPGYVPGMKNPWAIGPFATMAGNAASPAAPRPDSGFAYTEKKPEATPATPPPAAGSAPKIRRVDMTPPHPPRGACLNCHEP